MTRPAVLPLLVLCFALVACSVSTRESKATPLLAPTGESVTATVEAIQTPTSEPTADLRMQQLITDIKAANDRAEAMQKQLDAQNERISNNQVAIAKANADAAKYNDAQRAKDVDVAREVTAQKEADAANNAALAELAKAQAQEKQAQAQIIASLCLMLITASAVLVMVRAMWRNRVFMLPALEVTEDHAPEVYRPIIQTAPNSTASRPIPVTPETFAAFMAYAVQEKPLGVNKICDDAKIIKRADHGPIMRYLQELGYIGSKNSASVLTDTGIDFGNWWLEKYAPHPAPDASMTQSVALPRNDHENHGMNDGGGDVSSTKNSDDVVK